MKIANNYSKIKNRDKKIYSFSGTKISETGISYMFLKVLSVFFIAFNIVGVIICMIGGEIYYIPIRNGLSDIQAGFPIVFIGGPFLITILLLYTKIQRYTLLDFLISYFRPKRVRDQNGKVISYTKYKQEAIVEKVI